MPQYIQSNGIRLAYEEHAGPGETLLLMHGLTANLHSFDGLLRAGLADDGLHLLCVDLRGRGLSDKPQSGYAMADHAADMLGLMDAKGIAQAVLVGHSFGGLLSIYMAEHHPERIKKVVLIDVGLEATAADTLDKIKPSLERLDKALPSWTAYIEAIKASPYYADGFWNEDLEAYYRADVERLGDGSVRSRVYAKGIEEAVTLIIQDDWQQHIRNLSHPTLLIHAPAPFGPPAAPPILSVAGAQETLQLLPNAQYVQVPGHHITMLFGEHAPHVVQAIREFVRA